MRSGYRVPGRLALIAGLTLVVGALLRWDGTGKSPAILAGRLAGYTLGLDTPMEFVVFAIGILIAVAGVLTPRNAQAATATLVYLPASLLVVAVGVIWLAVTTDLGLGSGLSLTGGILLFCVATLRSRRLPALG